MGLLTGERQVASCTHVLTSVCGVAGRRKGGLCRTGKRGLLSEPTRAGCAAPAAATSHPHVASATGNTPGKRQNCRNLSSQQLKI